MKDFLSKSLTQKQLEFDHIKLTLFGISAPKSCDDLFVECSFFLALNFYGYIELDEEIAQRVGRRSQRRLFSEGIKL